MYEIIKGMNKRAKDEGEGEIERRGGDVSNEGGRSGLR